MKLTLLIRSASETRSPQHYPVDDAEQGRHATDAEGEDGDRQRAEKLVFDENADADPDASTELFSKHGLAG